MKRLKPLIASSLVHLNLFLALYHSIELQNCYKAPYLSCKSLPTGKRTDSRSLWDTHFKNDKKNFHPNKSPQLRHLHLQLWSGWAHSLWLYKKSYPYLDEPLDQAFRMSFGSRKLRLLRIGLLWPIQLDFKKRMFPWWTTISFKTVRSSKPGSELSHRRTCSLAGSGSAQCHWEALGSLCRIHRRSKAFYFALSRLSKNFFCFCSSYSPFNIFNCD